MPLVRSSFVLSCVVSGGDVGARDAKLSIMVGGDKDVYEKVIPLFQVSSFSSFHPSAWEPTSATWERLAAASTPRW